jgi:hypothetical protein
MIDNRDDGLLEALTPVDETTATSGSMPRWSTALRTCQRW